MYLRGWKCAGCGQPLHPYWSATYISRIVPIGVPEENLPDPPISQFFPGSMERVDRSASAATHARAWSVRSLTAKKR